jgi:hypothetical protein
MDCYRKSTRVYSSLKMKIILYSSALITIKKILLNYTCREGVRRGYYVKYMTIT